MRESATIVKLPAWNSRYAIGGYKAPRLGEAYKFFTNRDLQNAHNALNDVFACKLVHKGILQHQATQALQEPLGQAG
jgi:DNA polymerase-3 subunit epsilon